MRGAQAQGEQLLVVQTYSKWTRFWVGQAPQTVKLTELLMALVDLVVLMLAVLQGIVFVLVLLLQLVWIVKMKTQCFDGSEAFGGRQISEQYREVVAGPSQAYEILRFVQSHLG
jgi:hypothetical protein